MLGKEEKLFKERNIIFLGYDLFCWFEVNCMVGNWYKESGLILFYGHGSHQRPVNMSINVEQGQQRSTTLVWLVWESHRNVRVALKDKSYYSLDCKY